VFNIQKKGGEHTWAPPPRDWEVYGGHSAGFDDTEQCMQSIPTPGPVKVWPVCASYRLNMFGSDRYHGCYDIHVTAWLSQSVLLVSEIVKKQQNCLILDVAMAASRSDQREAGGSKLIILLET